MKKRELFGRIMYGCSIMFPLFIVMIVRAAEVDMYSLEVQPILSEKIPEDAFRILSVLNSSYDELFALNDNLIVKPLDHQLTAQWLKSIQDLRQLLENKASSLIPIFDKLEAINNAIILALGTNYKVNIEEKEVVNGEEINQFLGDQLKDLAKEAEKIVLQLKQPRIRIMEGSPKDLLITFGNLLSSAVNDHILPKIEEL